MGRWYTGGACQGEGRMRQASGDVGRGGDTEQTAAPPQPGGRQPCTASLRELTCKEAAAWRSRKGKTHAAQRARAPPKAPPLRPPALSAKGGGHEHRWELRRPCAARPSQPAAAMRRMQLAGEAGHWWVSPTPPPGHGGRVCLLGRQPAPGQRQRQQGAPPTPHTLPSPADQPTTDVLRVKAVQRGRDGVT